MTAETMTTAVGNIMSVVSTVVTTISGNAVLMTFFCAGLVGVAIGLVHRLRGQCSVPNTRCALRLWAQGAFSI